MQLFSCLGAYPHPCLCMSSVTNISACVSFQAWTDPCGQDFAFAQLGPDRDSTARLSLQTPLLFVQTLFPWIYFLQPILQKMRCRRIFLFLLLHQCNVRNKGSHINKFLRVLFFEMSFQMDERKIFQNPGWMAGITWKWGNHITTRLIQSDTKCYVIILTFPSDPL